MKLKGHWQRGFRAACNASGKSTGPQVGYRVGAALYASNNLISNGYNVWGKTTPMTKHETYVGNLHAEMLAISKRRHYDNSSNLTLYVWRSVTNSSKTKYEAGCSRPCPNCMKLIKFAGVRRVRFYDETGNPAEIKL